MRNNWDVQKATLSSCVTCVLILLEDFCSPVFFAWGLSSSGYFQDLHNFLYYLVMELELEEVFVNASVQQEPAGSYSPDKAYFQQHYLEMELELEEVFVNVSVRQEPAGSYSQDEADFQEHCHCHCRSDFVFDLVQFFLFQCLCAYLWHQRLGQSLHLF